MSSKSPTYDIFISYRRDGGYETALPIVEKLRSAGYRVFFDLESMNSGKFNEQLISVIDGAKDFVLVLPAHGLDRCENEDDWVRREITRAIEKKKNIIPVMLKGFTWPEHLPDVLAELPDYQGLSATAPEHFDLAVERLKSYLVSRPRRPLKKWVTYTGVSIAALLVLAAVAYFAFLQLAKPVCQEAGTRITLAMNVMHEMAEVNENFDKAWQSYISQRSKASRQSAATLDADFIADINTSYIPSVEKLDDAFPGFPPLSNYDKFLLGLYDIDPADIDGLKFVVTSQAASCREQFNICRAAIENGLFNTASLNTLQQGTMAERYGMNMLYYRYLEFMSHLPGSAWASHREMSADWHLYPSVSESLGADEYARLADKEQKKMEKAIEPVQAFVEMLSNKTNQLEEYLSDMQQELELAQPGDTGHDATDLSSDASAEIQAAQLRIEAKSRQVAESRRKLTETEQKLLDEFESYKNKFRIDGTEDQYLKWGKVIKAADYLALTVNFNRQRKDIGMEPTITNEQALQYVREQLQAYRRYHPETRAYAQSAEVFYSEVARGTRNPAAMIMMGTQHDTPHPLLRPGDIIIERNGVTDLPTFASYKAAAAKNNPGNIRFLRLSQTNSMQLQEIAADFPTTDVNIGLLQLKD